MRVALVVAVARAPFVLNVYNFVCLCRFHPEAGFALETPTAALMVGER